MARGLVVYESIFGNGQEIARAIAQGMSAHLAAEAVEVGHAPTGLTEDVTLVVVGGPNHATGMSTAQSRASAAKEHTIVSTGIGLREWFDALPPVTAPVRAAAYDTRVSKPFFMRWLDRASRGIEGRLKGRGFKIAAPAEHFWVEGYTGPLRDGELERARAWGASLAEAAVRRR